MPSTEIETIQEWTRPLTKCPVCGEELRIMEHVADVGDDYGGWRQWDVYVECGHSLKEMKDMLQWGPDTYDPKDTDSGWRD